MFSRYQKKLLDLQKETDNVKNRITSTEKGEGDDVSLKGVSLAKPKEPCRREHHLYVTDTTHRSSSTIIHEVVASLNEFLTKRTDIDRQMIAVLKPSVTLSPKADLKEVHNVLCKDLDLEDLDQEYDDILHHDDVENFRMKKLSELIHILSASEFYRTVTIALSQILAAKPHSADVERLISCNNILKTPGRSSMELDTANLFLYVHYNIQTLSEWDPRPALYH